MDKNAVLSSLVVLFDLPSASREAKIAAIAEFCKSGLAFQAVPKSTANRLFGIARQQVVVSDFNAFGNWLLLVEGTRSSIPEEIMSTILTIFTDEVVPVLKAKLPSTGKRAKKSRAKVATPDTSPSGLNSQLSDDEAIAEVLDAFTTQPTQEDREGNKKKALLAARVLRRGFVDNLLPLSARRQLAMITEDGSCKAIADDMEHLVNLRSNGASAFPHRLECLLYQRLDWFYTTIIPLLCQKQLDRILKQNKENENMTEEQNATKKNSPLVMNETEVDQVKVVLREVLAAFAEAPAASAKEENRTKGQLVASLFKHSWIEKYLTPTAMAQLSRTYVNDPVRSFTEDMECLVIKTAETDTFPYRFEQILHQQLYWFLDAVVPELKEVMKLLEAKDEEGAATSTDNPGAPDDRVRHEHGVPYPFTPQTPPHGSTWQAWISPPKQAVVINPFAVPVLDEAAYCFTKRLLNLPQHVEQPQVGYGVRGPDGRQALPHVSPIKKLLQVLSLRRTMAAQVTLWVLQLLDQHDEWGSAMQAALSSVLTITGEHVNGQPEDNSDKPTAWVATQLRRGLLKYINTGDPSIVSAVLDTLTQALEPLGNI